MSATEADLQVLETSVDTFYVQFSSYGVFMMQLGFCMLEAGSVRKKNVTSILVKNLSDVCITAIMYWFIGFSLSWGTDKSNSNNTWIGGFGAYFLEDIDDYGGFAFWMFHWAFASANSSIVSGALAERCEMAPFLGYCAIVSGFVYPVVSNWAWNPLGWLSSYNPNAVAGGVVDFAGGGVVHFLGGIIALVGCIFLGPRSGRFTKVKDDDSNAVCVAPMNKNSNSFRAIGVFMLWNGWYYFNAGSTFGIAGISESFLSSKIAVNTTLGPASCAMASMLLSYLHYGITFDIEAVLNGIIAGLVSITSGCAVIESWAAVLCGVLAAPVWMYSSHLLKQYCIDDVVDAIPIHAGCGAFGLIFTAFFATGGSMVKAYGFNTINHRGIFYGGNGELLGAVFLFLITCTAFVCVVFVPYFWFCSHQGWLRLSKEDETDLLDLTRHGPYYNNTPISKEKLSKKLRHLNPSALSEVSNEKTGIDKATLVYLAFENGVDDIISLLQLWDELAGGSTNLSGEGFTSFEAKIWKLYQPSVDRFEFNTNASVNSDIDSFNPEEYL